MGVSVGVCVGVSVGVDVGVFVGVDEAVSVGVVLGVLVGVEVGVEVGVGEAISLAEQHTKASLVHVGPFVKVPFLEKPVLSEAVVPLASSSAHQRYGESTVAHEALPDAYKSPTCVELSSLDQTRRSSTFPSR